MRMVQELTQALTRILFLRKIQDYPQATQEIEGVLMRFWKLTPEQVKTFSVEQWIAQCQLEEGPMGEKLVALAELFREQGELYELEGNFPESQRSAGVALGLFLEAVTSPGTTISMDLLAKIEQLTEHAAGFPLPTEVLKRLLSYYETRGMFAKAEDVLFDWLGQDDRDAPACGLAFYDRLTAKSDQELEKCGLPRQEVLQGRAEVEKLAREL